MQIPYGTSFLDAPVPDGVRVVLPNAAAPAAPERDLLRAALERPVAGAALRELARGRRSAIVLISCRTRRTGSHLFVPLIRSILNDAGIPDDRILVYTATGTHDNWRDEDAPLLLGAAAGRIAVRGHDCRTEEKLAEVGTTSFGNRVRLSRAYLEADLKISTGRVTHHYFAGFSAGPKAILPGVAALDAILVNHRRTILFDDGDGAGGRGGGVRLNPAAGNGILDGNPVHDEMVEVMRMAPPDFSLLTVLNVRNEVTHAFGGETLAAHACAVAVVRETDAHAVEAPADLILLSPGGAPLDVNLIQSLKALVNVEAAIRPGGAVVLAAECPEGGPDWLLEAGAIADPSELARRIAAGAVRQGHNALWIAAFRRRAHVVMVTRLGDAAVRALGFHPAPTLADALAVAERLAGPPRTMLAVPYGNITFLRGSRAER